MSAAPVTILDALLVGGLLAAAGLTLFVPRRSTAVVMFLVFGVLLAIAWTRLGAPDVALAEAAIGAGVTSALLIDAVYERSRRPERATGHHRQVLAVVGAVLAAVLAVGLALVLVDIGPFTSPGPGAADLVADRLDESGVSHPVTAVLLNFRSYDTLLEIAVLLVAVLAALALQPDATLRGVPAPTRTPDLLGLLVRVLAPVLVVVAGWLLVAGSVAPGGAFQAGAVLAGGLLLMRLGGWPGAVPASDLLRPTLAVGLTGFLTLAYLTAALGAGWLDLGAAWAGEAILALEALLTVSIAMTLAALFVANQDPPTPPVGVSSPERTR
ncbi:hydrogenase subunit MbhD domain-containing protein [Nocardioides limicola]|uniref:hydrogenase subunit MbhD domain-containing protein n=1 Tax=Nocardioides limicola TaxID=2803368 RepID=UPI00193BAFEA|nr:hydrogenase subunit MbhD domain-containing protein [Nocardioides sp. DJM-14]